MVKIRQDRVKAVIRDCLSLSSKPQAQAVVIGLFLEQKSLLEVAEDLALTLQQVLAIKSDTLNQLRNCRDFVSWVEEIMSNDLV